MSSSKRRQSPYGEATSAGRCCAHSTCAQVGKQSFMNLLQDDVFLTPCEGVGGEAEGRSESGTGVGLAAAARHTYTHTNTHAQVEEHQGHDDYTRPSRANKFSTALDKLNNIQTAKKATDGEEEEAVGGKQAAAQGEDEPEQRLCGGCQKPKARTGFATQEWEKADAWSREAARRCKECAPAGVPPSMGGDGQSSRPKRKAAVRTQQEGQGGSSETCEGGDKIFTQTKALVLD